MSTYTSPTDSNCIRFDWAAKYILRNKADFIILEGLVSAVLGEKITITELLESESNQRQKDDKYNRVDIKAKNSKGDIILIEIQQTTELYFSSGSSSALPRPSPSTSSSGKTTET